MSAPLSIVEMAEQYPDLFYEQTWYRDEPFASLASNPPFGMPIGFKPCASVELGAADWKSVAEWKSGEVVRVGAELARAVHLCALYVCRPDHAIWHKYLWTSDTDSQGQRVYIGKNKGRMEIHRHLHLTERWGVPTWHST